MSPTPQQADTLPYTIDDVTVVVVVFNSRDVIGGCLKALAAAGVSKVILVDNASSDDTVAVAGDAFPGLQVVSNPVNYGYGVANNIGMAKVETAFGMILNPDTEMVPGCLETLLGHFEQSPNLGCCGPALYSETGEPELYSRPSRDDDIYRLAEVPGGPFCTWFITGAAMLWRMDVWRALGGYDQNIFIYSEDYELCRRAEAAGFPLVIEPAAVIRHLGGRSDRPSLKTRSRRDWHMTWSRFYVETKTGRGARARKAAWSLLFGKGLKALVYFLILRWNRAVGNLVKAHAAWSFLTGRPAHKTPPPKTA